MFEKNIHVDISAYRKEVEKELIDELVKRLSESYRLVVEGTPVRSGYASANWNISADEPDYSTFFNSAQGRHKGKGWGDRFKSRAKERIQAAPRIIRRLLLSGAGSIVFANGVTHAYIQNSVKGKHNNFMQRAVQEAARVLGDGKF